MIARRLENLLALDYPPERLEILVASDASADGTDALVEASRRPSRASGSCAARGKARLRPRTGRCARRRARFSRSRTPTRSGSRTRCGSSCATSRIPTSRMSAARASTRAPTGRTARGPTGASRAGCDKANRSSARSPGGSAPSTRCGVRTTSTSIRGSATILRCPYLMVQRGRRAVYDTEALASEKPSRDIEDEYRRKVRMFEHCWRSSLRGKMLRGLGPRLPRRGPVTPAPALCERAAAPRPARLEHRARRRRGRLSASCSARSSGCSPRRSSASASRATTCS